MAVFVALEGGHGEPLHRQLYAAVRHAILAGNWRPGSRVPSTRLLAEQLDVSRNTVMNAFEELLAEGYLVGRVGSGTYVATDLPEPSLQVSGRAAPARGRSGGTRSTDAGRKQDGVEAEDVPGAVPTQARGTRTAGGRPSGGGSGAGAPGCVEGDGGQRNAGRAEGAEAAPGEARTLGDMVSARGTRLTATPSPFLPPMPASLGMAFRPGTPAIDRFPIDVWGQLLARRWARSARSLLERIDVQGYGPLRQAVADYVTTARGVRCSVDQVILVGGTQQALTLTAQVLLDPGDAVWVEDPGYLGARGALVAASASLVPVPVDAEGIDVAAGIAARPDARLAVVTAAHQFPLGGSLSAARREALLTWARKHDAWVFEDDYDSEFRYTGRPLPALQGMDAEDRVIYAGTFSKVLSSSLRLAYLVVPRALLPTFLSAKAFADVQSPTLEQAVLSDFITEGHFARHIRRMRVLYARRQKVLLQCAARELDGLLDVRPEPAGMHLLGWLPPGRDEDEIAARAWARGLVVLPLSMFRIASRGPGALVLGYAAVPEAEIVEGVRTLREALR
ncbi:PLP-dependent aminotransferase family protein [Chondromyces crocatus]|uniref:Decarboxylase n=1 Tax=Chondromyces crocatus TaxID=52 RepID=A0A0K1EI99_CHOCO|nr:PLP-dependent aminotransferase family protein [Chondromyces crocatus]AKT40575.1 decarboxylase [Chondromyces crocatus]